MGPLCSCAATQVPIVIDAFCRRTAAWTSVCVGRSQGHAPSPMSAAMLVSFPPLWPLSFVTHGRVVMPEHCFYVLQWCPAGRALAGSSQSEDAAQRCAFGAAGWQQCSGASNQRFAFNTTAKQQQSPTTTLTTAATGAGSCLGYEPICVTDGQPIRPLSVRSYLAVVASLSDYEQALKAGRACTQTEDEHF